MQAPQTFQQNYEASDWRVDLILALRDYSYKLADKYVALLIENKVPASGELVASVAPWSGETSTTTYEGGIEVAAHWRYVEYGRKAGTWPPINKIAEWIRQKPITPRPYVLPSGRQVVPTTKQLAYLISRKIFLHGIDPRPLLQEAAEMLESELRAAVTEAVRKGMGSAINVDTLKIVIK